MKVWYDACTGKHVRYGVAVARKLRTLRHEVVLTTRKHPDTLPLAEFLNEKFIVVGKYNPKSLLTRLEEGTRRQLKFCKLFEGDAPRVAISHGSVDQCRVAFGLGIPVVSTIDAPHADAVNRLTLPLSNHVVASKAIPKEILQAYATEDKIVGFDGVDEVAWVKGFRPKMRYDLGKPLIVIRQLEEKAVYTKETIDLTLLARKLTRLGKVVFLSRYKRKNMKNLIVPKGFIDSASLVAQADLFIGVGGTITREAALQGTPAIIVDVFRNQYVNEFLTKKGFPIFRVAPSKAMKTAEELLGKKHDVKRLLDELENPVDIIAGIAEKYDKH
jgi:predicted glycosyltransferase